MSEQPDNVLDKIGAKIESSICTACEAEHPEWQTNIDAQIKTEFPEIEKIRFSPRALSGGLVSVIGSKHPYWARGGELWTLHLVPCFVYDDDGIEGGLCRKHLEEILNLMPE